MKPYDHKDIEKKWQQEWDKQGIYKVSDSVLGKENYYTLVEFSYPSGNLHVGHWYAFAVPDIFARYKRMKGFNVLYPMGFDAFGLPAENAAIKLGEDPKTWTYKHMETMRDQLRSMGAMFDWDREVVSCDPKYYKWTQWMFNEFLKKDLVYRDVTSVNWCPKDQTILANEQVTDGKCERCGTEVVQKNQEQWMLRITKYADRLIDDLDPLDWPHAIKQSQKNWIGRSEGSEIEFPISGSEKKIKVFTTRADTLFGVTYVVLAPEHELVAELKKGLVNESEIDAYVQGANKKSELDRQQSKEKTGVELKGVTAVNPVNDESVPVWIADYVLAGYGTGAVMAVPAHDERDFEFAKKYQLPIKEVVIPNRIDVKNPPVPGKKSQERWNVQAIVRNPKTDTYLCMYSKEFKWTTFPMGGRESGEGIIETIEREIREETGYINLKFVKILGGPVRAEYFAAHKDENRVAYTHGVMFDLVDETRVPLLAEEEGKHEFLWLPKSELVYPRIVHAELNDWLSRWDGHDFAFVEPGSLIYSGVFTGLDSEEAKKKITEFVGGKLVKTYRLRDWGISRQRYWGVPIPIVYDPAGKAHPIPVEHLPWLLPTDVDHTPDGTSPLARSKELVERTEKIFGAGWRPEVETMDTFVDSSWYFYRYLDNNNDGVFADPEKIKSWMPIDLYMGGAEHTTMHLLYSRFWVKALHDLGLVDHNEAYVIRRNRGLILGPDGEKMSKSKGNVIDPDAIVNRLGADTVRMYLAFMGPYGTVASFPWDPNGVVGVRRFLERVWAAQEKVGTQPTEESLVRTLHKTVKKVSEDIEKFSFNTAISAMMIFMNEFDKQSTIHKDDWKMFLKLLASFAPHMTEELWNTLDEQESIHVTAWPTYNEALVVDDTVTLGVQVNGKVRAEITLAVDATESTVREQVLAIPEVQKWIDGKEVKKFIFIPKKIISIVI
ncbi:MAG: class I tRNA ligase family protein [bacterium]